MVWQASWKKFLIDMMYLRGQVTLYPNFPNQSSFSTNHMEPGAHISAVDNSLTHLKIDFEVPLLQVWFPYTTTIILLANERSHSWTLSSLFHRLLSRERWTEFAYRFLNAFRKDLGTSFIIYGTLGSWGWKWGFYSYLLTAIRCTDDTLALCAD